VLNNAAAVGHPFAVMQAAIQFGLTPATTSAPPCEEYTAAGFGQPSCRNYNFRAGKRPLSVALSFCIYCYYIKTDHIDEVLQMPAKEKPMTKAQIAKAVAHRGRPPKEARKHTTTLRLDPDLLEHFRKSGPGWQTRINDTLRRAVKRSKR
jgi:uncharacterized protein (DUF4415 family)